MSLPEDGQVIVFDELPHGSLARTGVPYRVEHSARDRDVLFVSMTDGHSARHLLGIVNAAKWHEYKETA